MKFNNILISCLFALLAMSAASCSKSDDNTVNNPSDPKRDSLYAGIERLADSVLKNTHVPGMIVGVWIPGQNIEHVIAKGTSDISTNTPMSDKMLVRIGSITKVFVTTVALQLVDEGKLSLDDKLSKFYPDFPSAGDITIRMLMNMTSGISSYSDSEEWNKDLELDPLHVWTAAEFIPYIMDKPLLFTPGTSFKYSNTNIVILGEIIKTITGQTPSQFLKDRIFDRLAMTSTVYPDGPAFPEGKAYAHGTAYDKNSNKLIDIATKYDPSFAGTAGAIISSVYDVQKFIKAAANGDLISTKSQEERLKLFLFPGSGDGYGLGIYRLKNWFGHNGEVPGYESSAYHNPQNGATIVIHYNMVDESETDALFISIKNLIDKYYGAK